MDFAAFSLGVTAILNSLKLIKESAGTAVDIATNNEIFAVQEQLIKLQGAYLDCQTSLQDLVNRNRELEDALAKQADWNKEAARYEPYEIMPGVVVMRFRKEELRAPEPIHYLCVDCFAEQKKLFLQAELYGALRNCGRCKKSYAFEESRKIPVRVAGPQPRVGG